MPTASDLCDQSVTVAQVVLRLLRVLVHVCIHATTLQPMTVVTQPLAQKRIGPGYHRSYHYLSGKCHHRLSCYSTVANAYRF
jgi:hypothetical protein